MEGIPIVFPDADLQQRAQDAVLANLFAGRDGEILPLIQGDKIAILAGIGPKDESPSLRKLGLLAKSALRTKPITPEKPVVIQPGSDSPEAARAIVDGAKLGIYRWKKYITQSEDKTNEDDFDITILTRYTDVVDAVSQIADGVNLARSLANENADVADSEMLERTIREIAASDSRCTVSALNETDMREEGLNLHLAVNQGSAKEPRLIVVTYRGGKENEPFVALIGKGVTFDTGGLNLKPTGSMETMRMDMSGTAAVIGCLRNTIQLKLACNVYFVCAIAENAVGARSYKPGDVIVSYCGKTVEIANTDAEGRLVLADANSYLVKNYKPDTIINIATLTGAVVIALGYEYSGLMSSDRPLADALLSAAALTDDRAWELPIYPELNEHVKSKIADIKNTGEPKCAGTLAGGEFLRQFAQCESNAVKWAHLDIAGTAKPGKDVGYFDASATGAGVRLLTQFLITRTLNPSS
jgi:leucyl aminopeptidase